MPRRSSDSGVKPFEFRAGIGGLPALGGMHRAGDPATIPPNKQHLMVNMRSTPGGMVSRPGLRLVFNTGVEECITGLTEGFGSGGALVLFPGLNPHEANFPAPGIPGQNAATFRVIFPGSDVNYSEYVFTLNGTAPTVVTDPAPVVTTGGLTTYGSGIVSKELSKPFLLNGKAMIFYLVADKDGVDRPALVELPFPDRAEIMASACVVDQAEIPPVGVYPACPFVDARPAPGNVWPHEYPVSAARVVAFPTNPFGPGTTWKIIQITTMSERADDPATGAVGVREILYFLAAQTSGGVETGDLKIVKWDGATQRTEFTPPQLDTSPTPCLGIQQHGPFILGAPIGTPGDVSYAAYRKQDGTWVALANGIKVTPPNTLEIVSLFPVESENGLGLVVASGKWTTPGDNARGVWVFEQGAADWSTVYGVLFAVKTVTTPGAFPVVRGACSYRFKVYALQDDTTVDVWPAFVAARSRSGAPNLFVHDTPLDVLTGDLSPSGAHHRWMENVGGAVYVGGGFDQLVTPAHEVYDVTDPTQMVLVYSRLEDETDENVVDGYSVGCLPSLPTESADEGFAAGLTERFGSGEIA